MNTTISRPIHEQINEFPPEIWGELDLLQVNELFSDVVQHEMWGFVDNDTKMDISGFNRINADSCFLCLEGTQATTQDQVDAIHQLFQCSFISEVMLHYSVNKEARKLSGYAVYLRKSTKPNH